MPSNIIVRDLPPLPTGFKDVALAYASEKPLPEDVARFLRHWSSLHLRELKQPYALTLGKDRGLIKGLLRSATIEELLALADFFWLHRGSEEGSTVTYLKINYNRLAREKAEEDRTMFKGRV